MKEFEKLSGKEMGVVRMSLGLVSNWDDVERIVEFARMMGDGGMRKQFAEEREAKKEREAEKLVSSEAC